VAAGFQRENISLVAADESGEYTRRFNNSNVAYESEDVSGSEGAGFGAVVGALVGLGAMAIPGIGPIIAAGPIAAALIGAGVGAAAGAVTGGVTASLVDLGVDSETATYYEEGLRRGGTLVVAHAENENGWAERVVTILNSHNPTDIDVRAEEWRKGGWSGYSSDNSSFGTTPASSASTTGGMAKADFEPAHRGGVRVYTPPNTANAASPSVVADSTTTTFGDLASYDSYFRSHYDHTYNGGDHAYDYYLPAYEYGYRLATDERYHDYDWDTIENSARQSWDTHNPGTWADVKDAVHHAWNRVKNAWS